MSNSFLIVTLLLALVPRGQELPGEFYRIPERVRDEATIVVSGTYGRGRGPCILRPGGIRAWALESWFKVEKVYRGKVGGKYIYVSAMVPKSDEVSKDLKVGSRYLILLRPSAESMEAIRAGKYVPAWDAMRDEEIVAIVELK